MGSPYANTPSIGRLLTHDSPAYGPTTTASGSGYSGCRGGRARTASTSSSSSTTTTAATARTSARRCGFPECVKTAKPGGFCISHGGGKKCSVDGCTTSVVSRGFCVAHGGGKRCQREGCTKSAQTGGFCWIHGGGKKCGHDGCAKRAQSGGACISHGGGKRCRIDGCKKVVQYEGLCVGHGGYRKCLSMNCAKKALPNGYCHGHGGNAKCHFGDCAKKAVHGGFCGVHRAVGSPQRVAPSRSSAEDSPVVLNWSVRLHEVATISPLMPVSAAAAQQPGRDWSHAIAEAKSGGLARSMSDQSVLLSRSVMSNCDPVMNGVRGPPPTTSRRLPTVEELQRSCSLERSLSPLKTMGVQPPPASRLRLGLDRIAPLLSAVESAQARDASPAVIKREFMEQDAVNEPPRASQTCSVHACGRFAKVDALCLLHHHLRHDRPTSRGPTKTFSGQHARIVRDS